VAIAYGRNKIVVDRKEGCFSRMKRSVYTYTFRPKIKIQAGIVTTVRVKVRGHDEV